MKAHGALVVIVGPSGSGKDTLIGWLRDRLAGQPEFLFVRRTVTRAVDRGSEDHQTLSPAAFEAAAADGQFAVTWEAHGLRYGLPVQVLDHVRQGGIAIANGSRKALPQLRDRFNRLAIVNLNVERAVLASRLAARGRESEADIDDRLDRAGLQPDPGPDCLSVDNSGPIARAGNVTLALIGQLAG